MIKVNLLKSKAVASVNAEQALGGGATGSAPVVEDISTFELDRGFNTFEFSQVGQIFKILLLVVFVVPLVVFEKLRGSESEALINARAADVQSIQEIKFEKEEAVIQYADSEKKRDILVLRNEELREVKVGRLLAATGLDAIQTATPEDVWLTALSFENGFAKVNGETLTDKGLDAFVKNLKKTSGFLDINVPKDIKRKDESGRVLNQFLVTFNISKEVELKGRGL